MPDDRQGSAWVGLPAMIGLLAFVAFAGTSIGVVGAAVAVLIVFLVVGAVCRWAGGAPAPATVLPISSRPR
ncbi:MAG TPA: hypothetical protein VHT29_05655 [Solirubrobacteraceae bacterium]|jgi:hypothetical protein|nr:hypothetical protein [Solirubrobacteraceae bacterium]